ILGTDFVGGEGIGILATTGATATLSDVRMSGLGAQSLVGVGDASLELTRVEVVSSGAHAIQLVDASSATAVDCRFSDTMHDAVVVAGTARLELSDSTIERTRGSGVLVVDDATALMDDVRISDAEENGVCARDRAELSVKGGLIQRCANGALWQDQSSGMLRGTVLLDHEHDEINVGDEADVDVERDESEIYDMPAKPTQREEPVAEHAADAPASDRAETELDSLLAELDNLVGLDSVKRQV